MWTSRVATPDTQAWHIGNETPPDMGRGGVVLHLAATLTGESSRLAQNAAMTAALCDAARRAGMAHVFVASTAAVYCPGPSDIAETALPCPPNPYGAAKLAAEQAALQALDHPGAPGLTLLRIGNVAGADALLGSRGPVVLDPVPGQAAGPLRSYIGPQQLAQVLAALIGRVSAGQPLPDVLNIAQPGVVAMGDLLDAAGRDWRFGPPRPGVVPRVGLATDRLSALLPVPAASAAGIAEDMNDLKGRWP